MIKKIVAYGGMFLLITMFLAGCSQQSSEIVQKERLVETKTVEEESLVEVISYIGFVEPKEIKKYSLKTGGTLNHVNVKSGDSFKAGDLLLALDTYEYDLGAQAASEQVKLAQLDLEKAESAKKYFEKLYNDNLVLLENGSISSYQLSDIKLQYDVKVKEYEQASKMVNQAIIDNKYKQSMLSDTALIADMDGYVVDVLSKEGEIVAQGYPLIIGRSKGNVINIGMIASDVKRIDIGKVAEVVVDEKKYKATVTGINMMPDQLSKTFNVELTMEDGNFLIGEPAKVNIEMGSLKGIWLDITNILNDGVDYVYIVKDGRASRKDIKLFELNGDKVRVSDLVEGDQIIISGTHSLSEGYKVKAVGEQDE